MQITVRYQSIDGVNKRKSFATLAGVRRYVDKMVGPNAEYGSSGMYAVSGDGVGKVTLVEVMGNDTGRPLNSLAAVMQQPKPEPVELEPVDGPDLAAIERQQAEHEAAMFAAFYPPDPGSRRSPGCTCSDQQLNLVGCDCAAEREVQ